MSVHLDLSRFDGRSLLELQSIKAARDSSAELLGDLVEITGDHDKNMQIGATWLLRAYLEEGARLSDEQTRRLAERLPNMHDGFARLHICQSMREIEVAEKLAEAFATFFRECLKSRNTFVRAWAPDGFCRLAAQHPQYDAEVGALIEKAMADPAASVRARARKILAEG